MPNFLERSVPLRRVNLVMATLLPLTFFRALREPFVSRKGEGITRPGRGSPSTQKNIAREA